MTGRDRGEGPADDLPDWKVMNSVECENTFPPVENKCHGVMFMKGPVQANDSASVGATIDGFDSFQSGGSAAVNEG